MTSTDPANSPPSPSPDPASSGRGAPKPARLAVGGGLAKPYTYRGEGTGLWQIFAWNFGRFGARVLSILLFRLQIRGRENIPSSGGVLLVTNHQSFLDPCLIGIAPSRQVHYMARDTLFNGGLFQYLCEIWNAFPIKRGSADLAAIRSAVELLDKGYILNIFPEGTRSPDGTIGPIAPGMSLILNRCKTDIPIVPVLVDGAFEAFPRHAKLPRPHLIRVDYGRPIPASEWRQLSPDQLALTVRQRLIQLQLELCSPHAEESQRRLTQDLAQPRRR